MKRLVYSVGISVVVFAIIEAGAIVLGGPGAPPPMASISDRFKGVDFSDLPSPSHFVARDGIRLTYHAYPASTGSSKGSIVLVHGSSGKSSGMHVLAKGFAATGYVAYALDIRGHGDSGTRGQIAYVGQLEDDLEDFMNQVKPPHPTTLAGFSSGGGFVLRFAGSARQKLFSNYLLLSPFLSPDAPTYRPNSGGWVRVGVPRWVAIAVLNSAGIRVFNNFPVIRFALRNESKTRFTPYYSYSLAENFAPWRDYRANIRACQQPVSLVAGTDDEVFQTDKFAMVFKVEGKEIPVTLVPHVGHIAIILDPAAIQAEVSAVERMDELTDRARK